MSVRFLDEVEHDVQELVSCLGVRMTDYDTQQHWDQLLKHTHTHTHTHTQAHNLNVNMLLSITHTHNNVHVHACDIDSSIFTFKLCVFRIHVHVHVYTHTVVRTANNHHREIVWYTHLSLG